MCTIQNGGSSHLLSLSLSVKELEKCSDLRAFIKQKDHHVLCNAHQIPVVAPPPSKHLCFQERKDVDPNTLIPPQT